jgi:hypothetical protein
MDELFTTGPASAMRFAPPKVNAPAPLANVMPPNEVPAVKLLAGVNLVAPPKVRESPAPGAVPPQLFAVFQLLSAPPPFQIAAAASAEVLNGSPEAKPTIAKEVAVRFVRMNENGISLGPQRLGFSKPGHGIHSCEPEPSMGMNFPATDEG